MMPLILVLLFASIQIAAVFLARSTALNAAQSGVNAQRTYQARRRCRGGQRHPLPEGRRRLAGGLGQGRPELRDHRRTEVTCTVSGRSLSVVPGVDFAVQQTAHGTVERVTTP